MHKLTVCLQRQSTHRERRVVAGAVVALPVARVCRRYCQKYRTRHRRWPEPESAVVARRTRCCTARRRGVGGGDGVGDAVPADGDRLRTNQVAACWTTRSVVRTMHVALPAAATMVPPIPKT